MRTKSRSVIGVDAGTQGVTALVCDLDGKVIAKGEHPIPMLAGPNGEREQWLDDWQIALVEALKKALVQIDPDSWECLGICPSGQMHAEGLFFSDSYHPVARLWCDNRNAEQAVMLSDLMGLNIPQRLTISRWLWTIMNRPELAQRVTGITTTAGFLARVLDSNAWSLGLGEARGMFPIKNGEWDHALIDRFNQSLVSSGRGHLLRLDTILPKPVMVGTIVGRVDQGGFNLTGLPIGTPIYSPEGDQPTTLAGTYVCDPGVFAFSGGTSICANLVTDKEFAGIHRGVEPFMTADGRSFLMAHVQNGTSFMNAVVKMFQGLVPGQNTFSPLMQLTANAAPDAGGIIILPTVEGEHGLDLLESTRSSIVGLNSANNTPWNLIRAAYHGSMFSIRHSVEAMRTQGITATKIVASGGVVRDDWCAQAIADIFDLPVELLGEAEEGSAYGAALMALYGHEKQTDPDLTWNAFLDARRPKPHAVFQPDSENVEALSQQFQTFEAMVAAAPQWFGK